MNNTLVSDIIVEYLPIKRKKVGKNNNICCPVCVPLKGEPRPDRFFRCSILTGIAGNVKINCYNCKFRLIFEPGSSMSKTLMSFLHYYGVPDEKIKRLNFNNELYRRSLPYEEKIGKSTYYFIPEFEEKILPDNFKSFTQLANENCIEPEFIQAVDYISGRGEVIWNASEYYWSSDTKNNLNKRVIIPFYHNDKIIGWTARDVTGTLETRYYSDTPNHFLFNSKAITANRKYLIVVEGIFDALALDCVATQGAKLSEEQARWLKESEKEIIVVPDKDKAGQNLINLALEHGFKVSLPWYGTTAPLKWGKNIKDVDEAVNKYGRIFTLQSILLSATDNKLRIQVERKKYE